MAGKPIHVAIWLPSTFYSAVAATLVEMLELVNALRRSQVFSFEFISRKRITRSTAGISFQVKAEPSRSLDALILLANCYRVGYQDVASFSRLFSRMTGLPPGEYRRQSE